MPTLYKYCSARRALKFLEELKLRYSPPLCFNDPFEIRGCIRNTKDDYQEILSSNNPRFSLLSNFIGHLHESIGILCLSETESDICMWSHYGDNHAGVAIGFDSNHPYFHDSPDLGYLFGRVSYSKRRPAINANMLEKAGFRYFVEPSLEWDKLVFNKYRNLFFTKSKHWSYEKEWRHIKIFRSEKFPTSTLKKASSMRIRGAYGSFSSFYDQVYDEEIISLPASAIISITLGANIIMPSSGGVDGVEDIVWKKILENPELNHIKVKRAALDPEHYSVKTADTEDMEELGKILWGREIDYYRQGYMGKEAIKERLLRGSRFIDPYILLDREREYEEKLVSGKNDT